MTTATSESDNKPSPPPTLEAARDTLISVIKAREAALDRPDRYAALLSRCRSSEAANLVRQVFDDLAAWQRQSDKRLRKPETYHEAIERFVGDLLRASGDNNTSGRIYHAIGARTFDDVPVTYDVFMGMLKGLEALRYVGLEKGSMSLRATTFWATDKLVKLAEHYGVHLDNISEHFRPEPPHNPLVLRGRGSRVGRKKIRGDIIKNYKRTETTRQLEADIRELNAFLAACDISGGEHHGYIRSFNNRSWRKGGRLYSVGGGYQQMSPPEKRLQMTINGEAVAEIDIKASHLTIYHAKLKAPLSRDSDPYEGVGVDRAVAKLWTVASFGNSTPATKWPPEMARDYKKDTGKDLSKVAKAKDIGKKMLEAFPALRKLESFKGRDIWGDLQFIEAEAVINTMLILKREHSIPSLSMHDGIIVPRSGVRWTKSILTQQYRRFVGVEPVLTIDPEEADYIDAADF
jgi:hypothetical protein